MIKTEVLEIKKLYKHERTAITKICGCYVDGNKNIQAMFSDTFLCKPEEETFKYFEIFKKTLSGSVGKNLINVEFPTAEEFNGGKQEVLLKLRDSRLEDEDLLTEFYQNIISSYSAESNYLILLIREPYDVPGKSKNKEALDDTSEEVYDYILCSICPVKLSKPGLSFSEASGKIENRTREWEVGMPKNGFLFPAFNDRGADIHSALYFSKDSKKLQDDFIDSLFGCVIPMSSEEQKEAFQIIIEETLGNECDYDTVKAIHEKLNEMAEEHVLKEIPEPLKLEKEDVKQLFRDSGVGKEKMDLLGVSYDNAIRKGSPLLAANLIGNRVFEVKTSDVVVKVNPERTDLVQTKVIDGVRCVVIEATDQVEVNGVVVK